MPVPEAVLDDTNYDIWNEVRPALTEAFNVAITGAVLYGTNIPASWTTALGAAGLFARATAAGHVVSAANYADLYEAIMGETNAGVDGLLMTPKLTASWQPPYRQRRDARAAAQRARHQR